MSYRAYTGTTPDPPRRKVAPDPHPYSASSKKKKSAASMTTAATAQQPRERSVEFRSVLRIRPFPEDEQRDDGEIILSAAPDGHVQGSSAAAAEVVLKRPTGSKLGNGKKDKAKSSTLHYGMSMLSKPVSALSPSKLAGLRGGGCAGHGSGTEDEKGGDDEIGTTFQFDSILDATASQKATYDNVAINAALDATEPLMKQQQGGEEQTKDHVLITVGTPSSGKTHTAIGSGGENAGPKGEGVVPRLIDDLFGQYERNPTLFHDPVADGTGYALRLTMVHVHNDRVYDMLSTSIPSDAGRRVSTASSVKKMVATMESGAGLGSDNGPDGDIEEIKVVRDAKTGLYRADANVETCTEFLEARETLYDGLDEVVVDGDTGLIKGSRGHTFVTVQPVLIRADGTVAREGGTVTVVDLAMSEPTSGRRGGRDSRGETVLNVFDCLKAIKKRGECGFASASSPMKSKSSKGKKKKGAEKKEDVPYRQCRLTMLLQPLFSVPADAQTEKKTLITLLVASSPGGRDYAEKKSLLTQVESLRGLAVEMAQASSDEGGRPSVLMSGLNEEEKEGARAETPQNAAGVQTPRICNMSPAGDVAGRSMTSPEGRPPISHDDESPEAASATAIGKTALTPERESKAAAFKRNRSEMFPPTTPPKTGHVHAAHSAAKKRDNAQYNSPLPPTHPRSAKKRDNPFKLDQSSSGRGDHHHHNNENQSPQTAEAVASSKKQKTPTKSAKKSKRGLVESSPDTPKAAQTLSGKGEKASKSWLDISSDIPSSAAAYSHQSETPEPYTHKIKGLVNRSPLRMMGHAVTEATSTIVGHSHGNNKTRSRPTTTRDEEDKAYQEQRRAERRLEKERDRLYDQVRDLEEDKTELERRNESLEEKCKELMRENGNLMRMLEEAKTNAARSHQRQLAQRDDKKEEAERSARILDQSLLKDPLMEHMKKVMETSNEQMTWQLTDRPHFNLSVPEERNWTCSDLYRHQKSQNIIQEMGEALAKTIKTKVDDKHEDPFPESDDDNSDNENTRTARNSTASTRASGYGLY